MRSTWLAVLLAVSVCVARARSRPARGQAVAPACAVAVLARDGVITCPSAAVAKAHGWASGDREGGGRMPASAIATLEIAVDVNRASLAELATIPGVGEKLAQRIVRGRPYRAIEELLAVRGVGQKRVAAWRSRLSVTSPKPGPP